MPENSRPDEQQRRALVSGTPAVALSHICHVLHLGLMFFILLGWVVPHSGTLVTHLVFVPLVIISWMFNANSCPLNNIETWLTKGTWRDPDHREQGSFLVVVVETYLGLHPTQRQMDMITYGLMALAWLLSLAHWWARTQPA